jgi:hypothetical protein
MYEHILARGPLDESVTFGSVKPLHCTFLSHVLTPFTWLLGINPCFADVPKLNPEEKKPGRRHNVAGKQRLRLSSQLFRKGKRPTNAL